MNTLTCVYCGMAYPEGTPPHGAQVLTDHIKVCDKHPLRKAEITIHKLSTALQDLVGVSSKEELEGMGRVLRSALNLAPEDINAQYALKAIQVLLEIIEEEE